MRARRQSLDAQKPPVHNGDAPDACHITRWTRYTRGPDHSTCELRRGDVDIRNPRLAAGCCRTLWRSAGATPPEGVGELLPAARPRPTQKWQAPRGVIMSGFRAIFGPPTTKIEGISE